MLYIEFFGIILGPYFSILAMKSLPGRDYDFNQPEIQSTGGMFHITVIHKNKSHIEVSIQ